MIKPNNRTLGAKGKQANRASPDGNAPLLVLCTTFPPEGELFFPLYNEQLKLAQGVSEEQICPSGVASEHDS